MRSKQCRLHAAVVKIYAAADLFSAQTGIRSLIILALFISKWPLTLASSDRHLRCHRYQWRRSGHSVIWPFRCATWRSSISAATYWQTTEPTRQCDTLFACLNNTSDLALARKKTFIIDTSLKPLPPAGWPDPFACCSAQANFAMMQLHCIPTDW